MTIRAGRNAAVYLNGVDISGDLNTCTPSSEVEIADYATFGSVGHRGLPGLFKDMLSFEGLLDDAAYGTAIVQVQQTAGIAAMILYGQAVGDPAYAINECMVKNIETPAVVKDINKLKLTLDTDNYPFDPCDVLAGKAQKSGSSTGSTNDNLAADASGAVGYVQVFEQTGGTGYTLSIRHSSDNFVGDDTELLTFGNFTTTGTLRVTAASCKRYVRAKWVQGTAGTCTFAMVIHFQ